MLAGMPKREVRERIYAHMTEEHAILRPVAIAGPDRVWVACVGVEEGAWVFVPHSPTNGVTYPV